MKDDKDSSSKSKKQHILDVADILYFKYGFKCVSISDLCKEAMVSRKTFYTYFKNKEEVVMAVLEMISGRFHRDFRNVMSSDMPLSEKMDKVVSLQVNGGGTISQAFLKDMLQSTFGVAERYNQLMQDSFLEGVESFRRSQEKGEIRPDINPKFIIRMMGVMLELSRNSDFVSLFSDTSDLLNNISRLFLYGMLNENNKCGNSLPKDINKTSVL